MDLLIKSVTWLDSAQEPVSGDVRISGDTIVETGKDLSSKKKDQLFDFNGHYLYAGLINAHDHLEMNLYPRLGTPPYNNYTEWSKDIYKPAETPLKEIEKTDIEYRLMWGGLKNLVSGVTTVVHHNPWREMLGKSAFPVVVPRIDWAHSLAFEKKAFSIGQKPFVIHAAEGVDEFARNEIHSLDKLGLLKKNTVLVHGVGATEAEWNLIASRGSSLAWCPSSNLYMFNKTVDVSTLNGNVDVVLGTDSTLTGSPTLLDEMRVAVATGYATSQDVIRMTGVTAAKVFGLPEPLIKPGNKADLFITPVGDLLNVYPGDIRMIVVRGEVKTPKMEKLRAYFERKVDRKILEQNPLWTLVP
jgi:cytosine/adenosine deaminase-related metal-dependent hydrolase